MFAALADAGKSVAVVTAKDKLRKLLGHKMKGGICFSSEKAAEVTMAENGIEDVLGTGRHAGALGLQRRALGVRVRRRREAAARRDRPDVMYLSTTDYIQHKFAPGTDGANAFYAMMDGYLAKMDAMGCVIALTADHGMNAKQKADGSPDVIYLQDCDRRLDRHGQGARDPADHRPVRRAPRRARLVRHHLPAEGADRDAVSRAAAGRSRASRWCSRNAEAAERFELPPDRIGDLVVVSDAFTSCSAPAPRATTCRASTRRCARTAASASSACR